MHRRPDHELVALAREGSEDAVAVLFDRYWSHAWRAAYAVTADRALADDVAQDAVQQAFGALREFDDTRPFGPWLKRIAVNRAIDELRRMRRHRNLESRELAVGEWAIRERTDPDPRLSAVAEAVAALPEAKRIVVVLHYWLDLAVDEIAGVLGIPVGTVASRLSRAIGELRSAFAEDRVA